MAEILLRIRRPGLRVADRLPPVRSQAFEQAPEEGFVSRQACCPVGVSFGHEPLGVLLANCSVSRAVTHGHCLLPASRAATPWDWFYINAIHLDTDGNLLISARLAWAVYKVNLRTGNIIWVLGG
ncbi:MAG: arylsulfotransferase family protein, partial [Isosphaeraceae bacterium]